MKRKEFIRNIVLLGTGMALMPFRNVLGKSALKRYHLPDPMTHVPHGNFAARAAEFIHIQELSVNLSVERYMRNGIDPCAQDISVYSFRKQDDVLTACYQNGKWHISGALSGLETVHSEKSLTLRNPRFELQLDPNPTQIVVSKVN